MTNIIAIMGKKGCGKSTASKHLELSHGFKRISFADPLKCMLLSLGLSSEELWGSKKEVPSELLGGKTPRHAMQTLGTEWGRNLIYKDFWVSAWKLQVGKCSTPIVVDDLRYLNEVKSIKDLGGRIILIERAETTVKDMHISELELEKIPYDVKILNNGSIDNLHLEMSKLLRDIHEKSFLAADKEVQGWSEAEKREKALYLPAKDWEPKHRREKIHEGISKLKI